jgi:hypothetical protein
MASNACQNPLYLRTLLEEIRVFGSFEQLDAHIDRYLRAQSPPELFQLIFQRLEQDITTIITCSVFGGAKVTLVSAVLALTWVARRGLTEVELLEVLGITASQWAPLHLALEEALVSRSGFFTFFHDYMRQAVETRYIKSAQTTYRKAIIEYFTVINATDDKRVYEEVPYQLEQLKDWRGLASFITELKNFDKLSRGDNKFDLYRYWRAASKEGGQDPESMIFNKIQAYAKETPAENRASVVEYQAQVGKFLEDIGTYETAETLYRCVQIYFSNTFTHTETEIHSCWLKNCTSPTVKKFCRVSMIWPICWCVKSVKVSLFPKLSNSASSWQVQRCIAVVRPSPADQTVPQPRGGRATGADHEQFGRAAQIAW